MSMRHVEIQGRTEANDSSIPVVRTVGYCIANPSLETSTAICYFFPIGGCSDFVQSLAPALVNVKAKLISVDRPGCADTSWNESKNKDALMHRIHTHAHDVLEVLKKEGIRQLYVLGVCIGHAYAIEVSKQLLLENDSNFIQLKGITLVAPFVSTACPNAWRVARFGSHVPTFILNGATYLKSSLFPMSMKYMGPSMLKSLISQEEQEEFGWTDEDFQIASDNLLIMNDKTANCQAMEVRVGVDAGWQEAVCDEFAKVYNETKDKPPIRLHVSKEDKLASMESIDWITKRCYPSSEIVAQDKIHSHEVMTFFAGPTRNPVLLYQVCQEWGLYDCDKQEEH